MKLADHNNIIAMVTKPGQALIGQEIELASDEILFLLIHFELNEKRPSVEL